MTQRRKSHIKGTVFFLLFSAIVLLAIFFMDDLGGILGQTAGVDAGRVQAANTDLGWELALVNPDNRIQEGAPALTELGNGERVDTRIYPALQQMFDDMRGQGVYPIVASGYRSSQEQQEILDDKINEFIAQGYSQADAKKEALLWVAAVDHSEHQTGLAVDINADGINSTGQQVYDWLAENAWQYGFILRYPQDKIEITHTDYEPWHYRYVGEEAAAKISKQGMCLEEYIGAIG